MNNDIISIKHICTFLIPGREPSISSNNSPIISSKLDPNLKIHESCQIRDKFFLPEATI